MRLHPHRAHPQPDLLRSRPLVATSNSNLLAAPAAPIWRMYLALTKPRVVALIVLTSVVGSLLATPGMPPWLPFLLGNLGIGLAAASAATLNQILDQRIDAKMARTQTRPLPTGGLTERSAVVFAAVLGVLSMLILGLWVNPLTAALTFASLIGYAVIYTLWLKRATPQNIVIGGAAGAAPPVLGWAAITNSIDPHALLLFLIIFAWTPPHFWALAIARRDDYAKVDIPMLPVTHGVAYTRLHVLLYTIILILVTLLPWLTGMTGMVYLAAALVLNAAFLYYAIALKRSDRKDLPMKVFHFSVKYLMWLFLALLLDHYFPIRLI
jgi:heme o synthase